MSDTSRRVPPHLRRFVVTQDYAAYTAVDQAVWRFVLLQMYDRLARTAHPAYARGLEQTGMSVERIPRIAEMDACLGRFGWGAVCVDGFIPPRAFQELQSLGILPIAADIRSVEHLPYTPAPDIIHEAAGHAPILPNRDYAAFLRRIGAHGTRSFSSARDAELYRVIYELSEVKERRDATPREVRAAEEALADLLARPVEPSEAALLSRLYWWTVEYGLVGTPSRYKLYGAGLLSSLGESHFSRSLSVKKLALDRECVAVDYDITRPQPQLFVARDFGQLGEVLEEVCASFAFRTGGLSGLRTALKARELATVSLDTGVEITGRVAEVLEHRNEPCAVRFEGECAIGERGRILRGHTRVDHPRGLSVVLGRSSEGRAASSWQLSTRDSGGLRLRLDSGLEIVARSVDRPTGGARQSVLLLREARVLRRGRSVFGNAPANVAWLEGERVTSVRSGAEDLSFFPDTPRAHTRVPRRARESAEQRERRRLYERVARVRNRDGRRAPLEIAAVHDQLDAAHPHEWLLRWNLLELLTTRRLDPERARRLRRELLTLERHFQGRHPIATGLRHLALQRTRPGRLKAPRRAAR